jgi:integrase
VFPNADKKPWKRGGPGCRHIDQLKELAKRAGIQDATWKKFRHSLSTHGKGRFGMTKEQVRAQLRHATDETQRHYDHDDLANLRQAVKEIDWPSPKAPTRSG